MKYARDFGQMSAYDLIDYLDETNPRYLPHHDDGLNFIMAEAGKRNLIESLIAKKEREIHG